MSLCVCCWRTVADAVENASKHPNTSAVTLAEQHFGRVFGKDGRYFSTCLWGEHLLWGKKLWCRQSRKANPCRIIHIQKKCCKIKAAQTSTDSCRLPIKPYCLSWSLNWHMLQPPMCHLLACMGRCEPPGLSWRDWWLVSSLSLWRNRLFFLLWASYASDGAGGRTCELVHQRVIGHELTGEAHSSPYSASLHFIQQVHIPPPGPRGFGLWASLAGVTFQSLLLLSEIFRGDWIKAGFLHGTVVLECVGERRLNKVKVCKEDQGAKRLHGFLHPFTCLPRLIPSHDHWSLSQRSLGER